MKTEQESGTGDALLKAKGLLRGNMKNSKQIIGIIGFAILATACGNQVQTPDPRFLPTGQFGGPSTTNSTMPGYMQCSETINIRNSSGDQSKEYRACSNSGSMGSIKIFPVIQATESVCIFPSQNGNPLVYNSQYVAQCGTLSGSGSTLNFQGVNFDSIYVVPQSRASVFSQCLYYGNPSACSNQAGFSYAFGRIQ
jgi:hypothetical protein